MVGVVVCGQEKKRKRITGKKRGEGEVRDQCKAVLFERVMFVLAFSNRSAAPGLIATDFTVVVYKLVYTHLLCYK